MRLGGGCEERKGEKGREGKATQGKGRKLRRK